MTIEFSPEVLSKARRYLRQGKVQVDYLRPEAFWVTGSAERDYLVQTDADPVAMTAKWITCTCAHGLNLGHGQATCSHAAAVLLAIRDGLELPRKNPSEP